MRRLVIALCLLCSCVSDPPKKRWHLPEPEIVPVAPKVEPKKDRTVWT